ncbi:gas vesicle protein K [Methylobacter sp. Wu8]|uniref:gas vesicle protein K n=1 Tax=Methylobacter sp. Wu8 TaxID=3118457 RepID=UPI002F2BBDE4
MTTNDLFPDYSRVDLPPQTTQQPDVQGNKRKIEIDGERVRNGLAQLVLTLVKLLHELLERQAIKRMDSGSLSDEEIERLGLTLMRQAEELEHLREVFDLKDDDLNFNLGPLGRLL